MILCANAIANYRVACLGNSLGAANGRREIEPSGARSHTRSGGQVNRRQRRLSIRHCIPDESKLDKVNALRVWLRVREQDRSDYRFEPEGWTARWQAVLRHFPDKRQSPRASRQRSVIRMS
jgi:hypothetical protein